MKNIIIQAPAFFYKLFLQTFPQTVGKVKWCFILFLLIGINFNTHAQDRVVSGKVTDADNGQGLPGTTVLEKGTGNGTTTDIDGNFKLPLTTSNPVLVFSFIGFATQEITVGSRSIIDIQLEPDLTSLDEVLVIGYGSQKKSVASTAISKVDGEAMERMNLPNVARNLQGLATGISVSGASGAPGSNPTIIIRGPGTNGSTEPLVVVDGQIGGSLSAIAPADIESIQILKDAASAAIYGTKGANGVIIVTTKNGSRSSGSTLNYDGNIAIQEAWRVPELMNASQYVETINEKYANSNRNIPVGFPQVGDPLPVDTDWMGALFQPTQMQNHTLQFIRNNENGSVFTSFTYLDQEGLIAPEKSYFQRFTARLNSQTEINQWIKFGQNLTLVTSNSSSIPENNEFGSPIADALNYDPITPINDPNRQFGFAQSPWVQQEHVNPLSRIYITNNNTRTQNVFGNAYLEIKPLDFIKFRSDLGANFFNSINDSYVPEYDFTPSFFLRNSGVGHNSYSEFRWQWENYISITQKFGDHNMEFVLGSTAIQLDRKFFGASGQDLPEAALFNENLRYVDATPDSTRRSYGRELVTEFNTSLFARVLYNFKEKYLLTASLRRDGSSKFGTSNRYGLFPAVSGGWVISSEDFWSFREVEFLKVRVSYGSNGNDRIPDLGYSSIIAPNAFTYAFGPGGNQTIYYGGAPTALANPFLRWEASRQFDIGIESRFLNGKLGVEIDYYNKLTDGLLIINQSIPLMAGNNPSFSNLGEIRNSGIEFKIDFGNSIGDWDYNLSFNGSTLNNVVTKVDGDLGFINGYNWPVRNAFITRMDANYPLFYFRGYQTDGIFRSQEEVFSHLSSDGDVLQPNAQPGDLRFVDTNGDGVINVDDWTEIGKPWADFIFGFNVNASYKSFDLSMVIAGQIGNQIYRTYERQDILNRNYMAVWEDRWSESNPDGAYPRVATGSGSSAANNDSPSDFFVEDGDYARIRNIQIGYRVPENIITKLKMKKARVYVAADNLLTLTKYTGFDPEIGVPNYGVAAAGIDRGFYPQMRTISGGIQLSF